MQTTKTGPQPAGHDPKETDMLIPWSSALILLSITYGVFVLIALRGVCGVITDQLVGRRAAREAVSSAPATAHTPLHIVLPSFTPAVLAEA